VPFRGFVDSFRTVISPAVGEAGQGSSLSRLASLDLIRGVAILGMLWVNLPWHAGDSMSHIEAPTVSNLALWLGQYLFVSDKMQPIFALLFGAGTALQFERAEARGALYEAAFVRRMAVLLGIGIAHAYLVWPGDILTTYSIAGVLIYRCRRWSFGRLIAVGLAIKGVDLIFQQWPEAYYATLDRALFAWWFEPGEPPMTGVEAYAGSYGDLLRWNAWRNQTIQWTALPYFRLWGSCGPMLIGMALIRTPLLRGGASTGAYLRTAGLAAAVGLPPMLYGMLGKIGANEVAGPAFGFSRSLPLTTLAFAAGSFVLAGAYVALMTALSKRAPRSLGAVSAVGRTALTNYLAHSVICLAVFHGAGVVWNSWDQTRQFGLVVLIWVLELTASPAWLRRYPMGPVERAWRTLAGTERLGMGRTGTGRTGANRTGRANQELRP